MIAIKDTNNYKKNLTNFYLKETNNTNSFMQY